MLLGKGVAQRQLGPGSGRIAAIKRVRGYERKFHARREVLNEVDRLHQKRRAPIASRDSKP